MQSQAAGPAVHDTRRADGRAGTWRARGMGIGPLAASAAAPEGSASSPTSGSAARPRSPRADVRTCAQPGDQC